MLRYIFLLLPLFSFSQEKIPKGANTIKIIGVSFKQVANNLLDAGYSFEKIDSNFQTIRTEYKQADDYIVEMRYDIRIKDSVAIIKGSWVSGGYLFDLQNQKWGNYRITFNAAKNFAMSFNKPVKYSTTK